MNPEIFDDVPLEVFHQTEIATTNNFSSNNAGNLSLNQEGTLPVNVSEENGGNDTNNLFGGFDNFAIEPAPKFFNQFS